MPDKAELWLPPSYKPSQSPQRIRRTFKAFYQWTGFYGKTFWEILQLLGILAIPVVVVIASSIFSIQLNQASLRLSNQQHQTDIQIAADQQQETTLQNYLETISGLLLNSKLLQSRPGDTVSEVARVQTLTTLRRLNPMRKVIILHFLFESGIIGGGLSIIHPPGKIFPAIVSLNGADLSGIILNGTAPSNLSGADLSGADLSGADLNTIIMMSVDLSDANLSDANLTSANLTSANLMSADLNGANLSNAGLNGADLSGDILSGDSLSDADLSSADLSGADLTFADLSGANLSGTNISGANLSYTNLNQQQLDQVISCKDTMLPNGLTCHQTPSQ